MQNNQITILTPYTVKISAIVVDNGESSNPLVSLQERLYTEAKYIKINHNSKRSASSISEELYEMRINALVNQIASGVALPLRNQLIIPGNIPLYRIVAIMTAVLREIKLTMRPANPTLDLTKGQVTPGVQVTYDEYNFCFAENFPVFEYTGTKIRNVPKECTLLVSREKFMYVFGRYMEGFLKDLWIKDGNGYTTYLAFPLMLTFKQATRHNPHSVARVTFLTTAYDNATGRELERVKIVRQ
ncbi:MAG: hypothetical protein H0U27_03915 [Nitrosopumilus sp.]|nr:hypothetical protein [Nitrosopumilus sp.]